ncbi:MAG: aminotransferase class IV, partial [Chitinophagales bacterium]
MQQQFNSQNENILISINGKLLPRKDAKVSVFDSSLQGGDAVWEGIRVYDGKIFCLNEHLTRLQESAHSMLFQNIPSKEQIKQALFETLQANGMRDGAHIRLTLTRGEKITSGMDPRLNQKGCTLIVLAEWKKPVYGNEAISLVTASIRRNSPMNIDSKIHHNNLINNILAKIEANIAGADDALMLDNYGFVSETNSCNIFMIKNGVLLTPCADACLPGITRGKVLQLAIQMQI